MISEAITRYEQAVQAGRGLVPLLALRALKSDPIAGLPAGMSARLDAIDADWHWNGQRGLLQSNLPG